MRPIGVAPGAASLQLVGGVSLLRPEEQVFLAMLAGFANFGVVDVQENADSLEEARTKPRGCC